MLKVTMTKNKCRKNKNCIAHFSSFFCVIFISF